MIDRRLVERQDVGSATPGGQPAQGTSITGARTAAEQMVTVARAVSREGRPYRRRRGTRTLQT
jgi:hypothetical protein